VKGAATVPSAPTAISPAVPNGARPCSARSAAAASGRPAWRISASISCASAVRMIASPSPVQEMATVVSSAHVPAAISDESPTRPGCLRLVPPVDVAAATPPWASSATAPTVFPRCSVRSAVRNQSSGCVGNPASRAYADAESPTSIT
jgi:hypothetical protein